MESNQQYDYRRKILENSSRRRKIIVASTVVFIGLLIFTMTILPKENGDHNQIDTSFVAPHLVTLAHTYAIKASQQQEVEQHNDQIAQLWEDLTYKNGYIDEVESHLNTQNQLINQLTEMRDKLQLELQNAQKEIQSIQESIAGSQKAANDEKVAKEAHLQNFKAQLLDLNSQFNADRTALLAKNQELEESIQRNQSALEEANQLVAKLQKDLKENTPTEDQVKLKADLKQLRLEIVELQQKFQKEQALRVGKEELLSQLAMMLNTQKEALQSLEEARKNLSAELIETKQHYDAYLGEIAPIRSNPQLLNPSKRIHVVTKGDTLSTLSTKYYGTSKRWEEIYQANKEKIANKNQIKEGTSLLIP